MAEISIIIPVYNSSRYLSECLDSVLAQTVQDIEIICINDGSTDDSLEILQQYCSRDSRIKLVNQENQGVSAARNKGLEMACGEYVLFLDADDLVKDIDRNLILIQQAGDKDLFLFNFSTVSEAGFLHMNNVHDSNYDTDKERLITEYVTWKLKIRTGSFLVKLSLLRRQNLKFNSGQSYAEDVEFIVMMLYHVNTVSVISNSINIYRIHSQSAISKVSLKRFDSFFSRKRLYVFFKKNTNFNKLLKIYEGYLLPEAIIIIVDLWARKGMNFFVLKKFLEEYKLNEYLRANQFNDYTPKLQKKEILQYQLHPVSYFCKKRVTELTYLVKSSIYKILYN